MKPVPCNGCTLCCKNDLIRLLPSDEPARYKTVPHALYPKTAIMLDHKENGECIYLGEEGCTIHGKAPQMCKEMDCRNISKGISKSEAKRAGILRVWNKGRSMI